MKARRKAMIVGGVISAVLFVLATIGFAAAESLGGFYYVFAGCVWLVLVGPILVGCFLHWTIESADKARLRRGAEVSSADT